jgi:hypothetical protein
MAKKDLDEGLNADFHYPQYDGNEETVEQVLSKRRKTGGRVAGTPNKQKKFDVMATARQYGLRAIATVIEVMEDDTESGAVRLAAANSLLDRGFGRAKQTVEHTGEDGNDIQHRLVVEFVGQPPVITNNHGPSVNSFVVNQGERAPDVNAIGSAELANRIPTASVEQSDIHPLTAARMRGTFLKNQPDQIAHQTIQSSADSSIADEQVVVPEFKKPWE